MHKAQDVRLRLQHLLKDTDFGTKEDVPAYLQAIEWIGFAQQYREAADLLSQHKGTDPDLPRILLVGHAVECALKACLCVKAQPVPRGHNLVELADRALELGFVLHEPDLVAIVHLDSVFHKDLVTNTGFRVRYPTDQFEPSLRNRVSQPLAARIVDSLVNQASRYNEHANREPWSGVSSDA